MHTEDGALTGRNGNRRWRRARWQRVRELIWPVLITLIGLGAVLLISYILTH